MKKFLKKSNGTRNSKAGAVSPPPTIPTSSNPTTAATLSLPTATETTLTNSTPILAILKDGGEMLKDVPYLKAIAGILNTLFKIWEEIKNVDSLTEELLESVKRRSEKLVQTLQELAKQGGAKLVELENDLKEYKELLESITNDLYGMQASGSVSKWLQRSESRDLIHRHMRRLTEFGETFSISRLASLSTQVNTLVKWTSKQEATIVQDDQPMLVQTLQELVKQGGTRLVELENDLKEYEELLESITNDLHGMQASDSVSRWLQRSESRDSIHRHMRRLTEFGETFSILRLATLITQVDTIVQSTSKQEATPGPDDHPMVILPPPFPTSVSPHVVHNINVGIKAGYTYRLKNVRSGTCLDLSAVDHVFVVGWEGHGGDNQKWKAEKQHDGRWILRSVRHPSKALGLSGTYANNTRLIANNKEPQGWEIVRDPKHIDAYRIVVPKTRFTVGLVGHGNATNGTAVVIWGKWEAANWQAWYFEQPEN